MNYKKLYYLTINFAVLICLLSWQAAAETKTTNSYDSLARVMADSLTQRHAEQFGQAIDVSAIEEQAIKGMILDPGFKTGFHNSLKGLMDGKLAQTIIDKMPPEAYAKVIRVKRNKNTATALIRIDYGDQGFAYFDIHMSKHSNGEILVTDWYDYSTGQLYTQSLQQMVALLSPTPTIIGKLFDIVTDRKDVMDSVFEMVRNFSGKNYTKAVSDFFALDESLRSSRMLSVLAVQAGNLSGNDKLYHKTLANLERYFDHDPTMAFLLLDYYFLEKNYDKALTALRSLQASIEVDDAAMISMVSNVISIQGKYAEAVTQARRAVNIEPGYEGGYWSLLNALNLSKDYVSAVKVANELEQRFGYDLGPESLASSQVYNDLLQSAAYRKWKHIH